MKPVDTKGSLLERGIMSGISEDDEKLIKSARQRFLTTSTNWADIRREAISDQKFFSDRQYDEVASRANRGGNGAPQITINMLPNFVQQVENNIRQQNI